jgi:uncharacterized repeat protein (TIGR03943 family)
VNRQAQGIVMFVLGGAVLNAGFTDVYLRYVRAGFRPFLLAAGALLIVAAVATLWYELRPARGLPADPPAAGSDGAGHDGGHDDRRDDRRDDRLDDGRDDRDGHGGGHREPRIAWLLILPLFALIVVVPPALGSYAADRAGTGLQRPFGFPALPADDPLQLGVLDYAGRVVYDDGRSLGGRKLKITGFITIGSHGTPYLTRMVLNCCAADALPIKIALSGQAALALQPDAWVEVTGTSSKKQTKDAVNGRPIPYLDVLQVRPVPAPDDEYED